MNPRDADQRRQSLSRALGRLSEARELRGGHLATLDMAPLEELHEGVARSKRRRFFTFGDRARAAVEDD